MYNKIHRNIILIKLFIIDSIEYYGNLSPEFKEILSAFGLTVNYNPNIAGFSRN